MAMTWTSCSQIICQKSAGVLSMGAWVAMYHHTQLPTDTWSISSVGCESVTVIRVRAETAAGKLLINV